MAELEFILEAPERGRVVAFPSKSFIIGSDDACQVCFKSPLIGARHAEVVKDTRGEWWIRDLMGTGSVVVNASPVLDERLNPGDKLRIGDVVMTIRDSGVNESSNHWLAWLMSIILGIILVANEYLEDKYKQLTLSWALFGFCAMLLFNFTLPYLMGSIHAIWFFLSTLLGAGAAYYLYKKTPNHDGSIWPVGVIASVLMLAYAFDMIPPVPLVKRDIAVGYALEKVDGNYRLSQQPSSWWIFWRDTSSELYVAPGQRVYCFSSVFAPKGLKTRLYHVWQYHDKKKGWQTRSKVGFTLSGGRYDGFRGYTYISDLQAGEWKVSVETENDKTVAVQEFSVKAEQSILTPFVMVY